MLSLCFLVAALAGAGIEPAIQPLAPFELEPMGVGSANLVAIILETDDSLTNTLLTVVESSTLPDAFCPA